MEILINSVSKIPTNCRSIIFSKSRLYQMNGLYGVMSYRIEDFENDPNWQPSVGEKLDKIHFRNEHWHAEIDPKTGFGDMHYDKYDPNESVTSLANHMWESNTGKAVMITAAVGILDHVFNDGNLRKSVKRYLSD